ncbi:MAG TPA: 30S ribosomal protein S3 [candidate division Zixibacteria bacterium]|nr:30S ribosomal protein S3 [candidate division Zixibacteria bacterium]HEQ98717.1 30S ribosomal protein S3 [candidate division Zixibacteria bacterium]
MGQKTNPVGLRLGIIRSWNSKWFAERNFADLLEEDLKIRRYISKRLENAGLAKVEILRAPKKITVDIHSSRPGIVIGRKGAEVDKLREELQLITRKDITLNIIEVKKPELNAKLVADSIARQLEGRVSFRRSMKKAITASMKMGAEGIKITCGGRLGGAEIARSEKYMEGRVPLHTLRADIDYAISTANTTYGTIGVKVWICRGEILDKPGMEDAGESRQPEMDQRRARPSGPRRRKPRPKSRVRKKRPEDEGGRRAEGQQQQRNQGRPEPRASTEAKRTASRPESGDKSEDKKG